jgi:hypothetical protein
MKWRSAEKPNFNIATGKVSLRKVSTFKWIARKRPQNDQKLISLLRSASPQEFENLTAEGTS